jgi:hypothetical protein
MWHAWKRRGKYTMVCWESVKERDHSEDRGVDGWHRAVVNAVMNLRVLATRGYL